LRSGAPAPKCDLEGSDLLDIQTSAGTFDERFERAFDAMFSDLEMAALPGTADDLDIYDVLRYHLGQLDAGFASARSDPGKRIRPRLCLECCRALGGNDERALPVAAAIEMIHNFTLIHDDIQDRSELRRHRPTVWSLWGAAQAINAGDALFAAAHLMLNSSGATGLDAATILILSDELHRTTLRIVEGQVLDLGFEERTDVAAAEYLTMIGGKTAAIVRYACFAGATVAGANAATVDRLSGFGQALGVGFQIRDDLLGVWGRPDETGKQEADDIRRRKKSLPVLLLLDRLSDSDWERVTDVYRQEAPDDGQVAEVLALLDRYEIQPLVQAQVKTWHDRAAEHLHAAMPDPAARIALEDLTESLVDRRA
jgi:geranylgeranyl diphosphate synthase type I